MKTRARSKEVKDAGETRVIDGPVGLYVWKGNSRARKIPWEVRRGDVRAVLGEFEANRFSCVVTSPPYYCQRDYGIDGQIGLEKTIDEYVRAIADSMDAVKRVLGKNGTLFLNIGDTYYSAKGQPKGDDKKNGARRFGLRAVDASGLGVPRKTAIGIPWRVALAMISRGWILRSPIIWRRTSPIPEPTSKDRPWRTYEMVFLFAKSPRYFFNRDELCGDEDVWTIKNRPKSSNGLHAAAFPDELVRKCLKTGCPPGGEVLDPFAGTGTTLRVAMQSGHPSVGVDLNEEFCNYMVTELSKL